jgi:cell division protein FtsQ
MVARAASLRAALPGDIRLMNGVSLAVGIIALGVLLSAGVMWIARAPWFTIRAIEIQGDAQRNSAATIRANTLPRLQGSFFTLDLKRAQRVFESVPWVRKAVVRRVWPNRLAVRLEEHQPAARWASADGNERLLNVQGEVFEANLGEVEGDALPLLSGPDGSSALVLQMHQRLQRSFARLERQVVLLELSGRGSWSLALDDDAEIELGRGAADEVVARSERFVSTLTQVTQHYKAPLVSADLRHPAGYAVRLKGVTTSDAAAGPGGRH